MLAYRQAEVHDHWNRKPEPGSEQKLPPPPEARKNAQPEQAGSQEQRRDRHHIHGEESHHCRDGTD